MLKTPHSLTLEKITKNVKNPKTIKSKKKKIRRHPGNLSAKL
jgi:hypothetical protein